MTEAPTRIHIICFGNELHGDDGFGAAMHDRLSQLPLPGHVRLYRADIAGLAALDCFEHCTDAIVVDALQGYGPPGSVHELDAGSVAPEEPGGSHGTGVGGLLRMLPEVLPRLPRIRVVGAEIARIDAFRPGLSGAVTAALGPATQRILRHVGVKAPV